MTKQSKRVVTEIAILCLATVTALIRSLMQPFMTIGKDAITIIVLNFIILLTIMLVEYSIWRWQTVRSQQPRPVEPMA